MSKNHLRVSIKTKIVVAACTIVLVSAMIDSIKMLGEFNSRKNETLRLFSSLANQVNESISAQFFERYGDVQAFALNPTLFNTNDAQAISQTLNKYVSLYGIYDLIVYVDPQGKFIASNTQAVSGAKIDWEALAQVNYAEKDWFRSAHMGNFTEDKEKGFSNTYVEDLQIDPLSSMAYGKKMYGNSFSTRVVGPDGKELGVLVARANAHWIENELKSTYDNAQSNGFKSVEILILNKQGVVFLDYNPSVDGESVVRDFNILTKLNLIDKGYPGAREVSESRTGREIVMNNVKNLEQIIAYQPVNSKKFIQGLGWGILVTASTSEVFTNLEKNKQLLIWFSIGSTLFFGIASYIFASSLSRKFSLVSEKLKETAEHTSKMAGRLADSSRSVAEASGEQSAAVQETVSSMAEISSMISQTNQNLRECTDIAAKVSSKSEHGNLIMSRLASAMEGVSNSNHQLQSIANIISEVSAKTTVINDIVFKTQLLSINASIEAARAGQHGKGFSVVAEEVGNLAQMSGTAAKEIQLLIADSHKAVQQIIEVTQSRTTESQTVASEALGAFSEIASGVRAINERLQGVGQATKEQELGISQITVAMNQMDQTTQRNSAIAGEANELVKILASVSERNYKIMRALRTLVVGNEKPTAQKSQDIIEKIIGIEPGNQKDQEEGSQEHPGRRTEGVGVLRELSSKLAQRFTEPSNQEISLSKDPNMADTGHNSSDFNADDDSFRKSA